ncbi:LacI family transcriptional regulator [Salegentibacter sp. 24]|uniref:LacI family DNA-binding transcriptional regulator n=1 Tax=Salegentibacter sp. 24 TaxID=2183986 RepID=UPI00105BCA4A|nr:substrate-binding domain-containing protein [Salegentibacter sp. 24]TDN95058.1 LacI family transcriptional regulator [Salegentibacter sp. 24]
MIKKSKKYTLKKIAEKLNISVTTVSFVLNGQAKEKKISDEMIAKVLAYVKEIDYQPNQLAKSLRTGKSKIIVFMVEDISNQFFASIARIIEDLAYKKGYKVIFCSNENNDEKARDLINIFKHRQIDGYIIIPSPGIENDIRSLIEEGIPVVLFDRYFPSLDTNYVVIDNEHASYQGTKHLIENGYKKIGFITIDTQQNQMVNRMRGYQIAVEEKDLNSNILRIAFHENGQDQKKLKIKKFLEANDLDAILFSTNYLTQSGLEVLHESFPELLGKLGILTFDDHEFFKIHTPSISAISQPKKEIAVNLMNVMLQLLKKPAKDSEPKNITLNTEFIPRVSSQHR